MTWKIATVALGLAVVYLGYKQMKAGGAVLGLTVAPSGPAVGDPRGNRTLAVQQTLLGPKAVAEGAKVAQLGPELAKAREEAQKRWTA